MTAGSSFTRNEVESSIFGNHHSGNLAFYAQFEKKLKRLYLTSGLRFEYYQQDTIRGDSDFYFGKDSTKIPLFSCHPSGSKL